MSDYLMRDAAPLSPEVWAKIDGMVVTVASKNLVGRRFVELVGPLGWGVDVAPMFGFESQGDAAVATEAAAYVTLQELRQEFVLRAKHLAIAGQTPYSLDLGAVAIAAAKLAKAEDDLVLGGLLDAAQCSGALGDWDAFGAPFRAIAEATGTLRDTGFDAPFVVVMGPARYAQLASQLEQGRRQLEMVEKLVGGGLFQSPHMPADKVMVVSPGAWNLDLVVGQDVVTAYLGNDGLDHCFRIFETLALRVKRPGGICVLQ
ncbi:MAG: family 1 encapsulin nanocompartment shell protein [Anaerolineae bacterium]